MKNSEPCINCGQPTSDPFCGKCGQAQSLPPLTTRQILKDTWNTITLVNSPLKRTLKHLWKCPGSFVIQYTQGKRVDFLKPTTFFIMILAMYVLLIPYILEHNFSELTQDLSTTSNQRVQDQAIREFMKENIPEIRQGIQKGINFFYFLLPFALAFYMPKKQLEPNRGLVIYAAFYFVGMTMVLSLPLLFLAIFFQPFISLRLLVAVLYLIYAFWRLYKLVHPINIFSIAIRVMAAYLTYIFLVSVGIVLWMLLF